MRLALCAVLLLAAACNDGASCDTQTVDLGDVCIPDALSPDLSAVVDVREACTLGCTAPSSCTALFRNGQVVLDVSQDVCSDTQTSTCFALGCQQRVLRCLLPALPAGDYTLVPPGSPARALHVAAGGTASCRFPAADGGVQ